MIYFGDRRRHAISFLLMRIFCLCRFYIMSMFPTLCPASQRVWLSRSVGNLILLYSLFISILICPAVKRVIFAGNLKFVYIV